ncbi:DUF4233 domain-containing protein [Pseudonocardia sp. N23]|uniref:DUF4233 domain-containing protein n=1 Tax=Pseudonocardia sp. N23 TaxID=1987376 RepID=UPI000C0353C9|nr:DUF4233 domain-containing protein [Pseudonocardia sp. N23]GAY12126.1 probable conserved integral membrane protein [Pseudonocardia sp. N23]
MSTPETPPAVPPPATDPMKGIRGVFAMTLVLEAVVVLLAMLVLPKFGEGATTEGVVSMTVLAVAMIVGSGLQRRPWGLAYALVLQIGVFACIAFVPAMWVIGIVFVMVWGGLLLLRRDVARRMARGDLPSQRT